MSDLISRAAAIDAIVSVTAFPDAEYIKNLCQNPSNSEDWLGGVCDAINAVEDVNAVDAVPVVRCRDCVYGCLSKNVCGEDRVFCENPDFEGMDYLVNEPDWYCADGERRDGDGKDA